MSESDEQRAKAPAHAASAFGEPAQALRPEDVAMTGAARIDAARNGARSPARAAARTVGPRRAADDRRGPRRIRRTAWRPDGSGARPAALAAVDDAAAALATVRAAPDAARQRDVQRPRNTPFTPPVTPPEEHRRAHRSRRPRRIDTDPDPRAFASDRIDRMTSAQVANAVATSRPPSTPAGPPGETRPPDPDPTQRRTIPARRRTSAAFQ